MIFVIYMMRVKVKAEHSKQTNRARTRFSMDSSKKTIEDLNLSQDEITRLTNAFKNEEFRKLFKEYAEEIADPENKRKYEEEIRAMENERGMDVEFVHPEPGYVVKTTVDGEKKAFINICKNDKIDKPSTKRQTAPDGRTGLAWSIPHSFAPVRDDMDKKNNRVKVFDFVINPDTFRMSETNQRFRQMIHDTAFDGIEKQFGFKVDRKNAKILKMNYKGTPSPTVIRNRVGPAKQKDSSDIMNSFPYPYDDKTTKEKSEANEKKMGDTKKPKIEVLKSEEKPENEYSTPTYIIKHQSEMDLQDFRDSRDAVPSTRPKALVVEINLPLITKASQVDLDISENQMVLLSDNPAKYKLDMKLPYPVDENEGSAKFDKTKRKLIVTLPVVPGSEPNVLAKGDAESQNGVSVPNGTMNGHHEEKQLVEVISENGETQLEKANEVNEQLCNDVKEMMKDVKKTCDELEIESEPTRPLVHEPQQNTNQEKPQNISDEAPQTQTNVVSPRNDTITRTFADFDFYQNDESISFVIHAGKVDRSSVSLTFPDGQIGFQVDMSSVGAGGFPIHYSLYVRFPSECCLEMENCRVDVDPQNVVVILVKTDAALGHWESFEAGLDRSNTQERLFVTRSNLQRQLADLLPEDGTSDPATSADLEVKEMDGEKLVLNIKEVKSAGRRKKHLSESADDIEIVHDKQPPRDLKGIIKGSHTTSESSEDQGAYRRTASDDQAPQSSSNSPTDDDDDFSDDDGRRRKSVSFSEHVDQTTYKANQSVSSLHSTLKNKRKNQRKFERRQTERKESRRRRKTSATSSDDASSRDTSLSPRTSVSQDDALPKVVIPASPGADGDDEASPTFDKFAAIEKYPSDVPPPTTSLISELDPESGRNRDGVTTAGSPPREKPTVLDWTEGRDPGQHGTNNAVTLSNSVMFDLDID